MGAQTSQKHFISFPPVAEFIELAEEEFVSCNVFTTVTNCSVSLCEWTKTSNERYNNKQMYGSSGATKRCK